MSAEEMQQAVSRLEAVAARLESLAVAGVSPRGAAGSGGSGAEDGPAVLAYDSEILGGKYAEFIKLSNELGGDLQTQVKMVETGFQELRKFIAMASRSKKPDQSKLPELLTPLSTCINKIQEFRENNRRSPMFNHLSGISEAIPALGWVAVEKTPGPYVKEMQDSGMFYTNRVIKDFKETDQRHVDWTKAWMGTLRELMDYIKQNHTTGVTWNPQGGEASVGAPSSSSAPPPPAGGAPPPPPPPGPPPPPAPTPSEGGNQGGSDVRAALFDSINRGTAISSGLKKVSDDMKTHKNPALRAGSTVSGTSSHGVRSGPAPFKASNPPPKAPKPTSNAKAAAATAKPPVFELQQKKWTVEYQIGNKTMVIDDSNNKQTVYMYKCQDSTLQIKGKINSIVVDSCKKVAVVFDGVVSSIEFVNSQSVQAQALGQCPTVSIDKTDGCQVYLSKESLNAEIVTAKSSEMNILVPGEDGDFKEFALPEQFKSVWNGKKFATDLTESV
ncbi:adenylyl cyclase-associated protein 1-like [Mya arenaria]|uniref:adenylyl cyclase-associated protein 1-like n=1 Tax=Mya arenaria TaxID=6604 RepID=UPI0022E456A3|nr:adenylyl cyclase-associated protein 1-like [Mya arenaria]XP_052763813.1 adenylyl cyclase-associated protein 1-like [Mya arenaria]